MQYNTKLGLILFTVYLIFYGGFVLLNSFSPTTMEKTPIEGINLAIIYGVGLILFAFLLSMIYGFMCRPEEEETNSMKESTSKEGDA